MAASHEAALAVRDLSAGYDGRPVLRRLDLELRPGEMLGLLGPNGSGKTTLLRCLSGTVRPWSGEVRVLGRPLSGFGGRGLARVMAVVPQVYDLPAGFTVREIVAMGRTPHLGILRGEGREDGRIAEEALRTAGILHLAGRPVQQLSGGERQKVLIARALAQQPRILLLDEPTAHLDIRHQMDTLELVDRLRRRRGLSALTVLHDINLASQYCDRLVLMRDGAVLAEGPPGEVVTRLRLEEGFSARMAVLEHPSTARPVVAPDPKPEG